MDVLGTRKNMFYKNTYRIKIRQLRVKKKNYKK